MLELLYSLSLLEVVIGGGGRMAGFSPISVRGALAGICLAASLLDFARRGVRIAPSAFFLVTYFLLSTAIGVLVGYASGNRVDAIWVDVAQISFFLVILFFQQCFFRGRVFFLTERLFIFPAFFMALAYMAALFLIFFMGRFDEVYQFLSVGDDFFFRENGTFFFKGFVYLGVAFFFLLERLSFQRFLSLLVIVAAIILCNTRGMYMALAMIVFLLYFRVEGKILILLVAGAVGVFFWGQILEVVAKPDSDVVRLLDLQYVFDNMDFASMIFGHGFGAEINERGRIEVAWVEVLYKQGLIGLGFWLYWLFSLISCFGSLRGGMKKMGRPYFASALFIFILSFTNPFMNNSIGLVVLIVAHFSLIYLLEWQRELLPRKGLSA
jgi:hypothetical protein